MSEPPAPPGPPPPPDPSASPDQGWQRLDARMLLVHPVRELVRFLPVLVGLLIAGSASGGPPWQLLGVVAPIAYGIFRYLTTRFRVADGRVELSRGLLSRRVTSTPVARVRTVDLTASLIHRLLGLTTLRIGTGLASSDDGESLDLDGLPVARAHALRAELLHAAPVGPAATDGTEGADADPAGAHLAAPRTLATFDVRWLRFAPFTATGAVVVAATVGGLSQVLDSLDLWERLDVGDVAVPSLLGVAVLVVGALVVLVTASVLGYLVTNGGYRLTRAAGAWHVRRGLLTTRETSIDEGRLAGVALGEPLALRLAGGRHLQAIVTGVDRSESGSSTLVPPSPAAVATRVARELVGSAAPVDAPLVGHGPRASRRRWTRALLGALPVVAAAVVLVVATGWWWPVVVATAALAGSAVLAADRVAGLGHVLAGRHVVVRSGSLTRRREALGVEHVIGWNLRATWFQRRAGLTTLVATTAGGGGSVTVPDVPEPAAVALAADAVPGLVEQFLEPGPGRPSLSA
ncbi:PH domain-containing protein [Nocardioides dongxiaopingii]|uniref:PH domain-containing protein n=1 Tax=Nocardioides dongxiaopingii TaxID=2576036 RepID=UPI0010C76357|nr:PH domain-containing protein [Nocardioides dongxiaopingii]